MEPEAHERREQERSSHAIYGLIIITATLVADRLAAEDALESLLLLWGAGLLLLLAHVHSAAVAEAGGRGRWLSQAERHVLIADNLPVLAVWRRGGSDRSTDSVLGPSRAEALVTWL